MYYSRPIINPNQPEWRATVNIACVHGCVIMHAHMHARTHTHTHTHTINLHVPEDDDDESVFSSLISVLESCLSKKKTCQQIHVHILIHVTVDAGLEINFRSRVSHEQPCNEI